MNSSSYKTFISSRSFKTRYYFSPSAGDKPFLLLLHGFPSNSHVWHHQVAFFGEKGYGLVVPDMLGLGESSKPTDATQYKSSLLTKDLVELLDFEGVRKVIVIGQDWYVLIRAFLSECVMFISCLKGLTSRWPSRQLLSRKVPWICLPGSRLHGPNCGSTESKLGRFPCLGM